MESKCTVICRGYIWKLLICPQLYPAELRCGHRTMYMYLFIPVLMQQRWRVQIQRPKAVEKWPNVASCPTKLEERGGRAMVCTAIVGRLTLTRSCSAASFWHFQLLLLLLVNNITKCTRKLHFTKKSHKKGRRGRLPGCRHCGLVYCTWIYSYLSAEAGVLVRKLSQLTPGISLCSVESAVS